MTDRDNYTNEVRLELKSF